MDDPRGGTITFCRIYSGTLISGRGAGNSTRERKERIGRMLAMHANNREKTSGKPMLATLPAMAERKAAMARGIVRTYGFVDILNGNNRGFTIVQRYQVPVSSLPCREDRLAG